MGNIGIFQILILIAFIAFIVGTGYAGIYIIKQNPKLKKYIDKKNIIIISLIYIVLVSFVSGKNVAYGIGAFGSPYIITIINSLFRNKFKFNKIFDEKFYHFLLGIMTFGFISTTLSAIF